MFKIVFIIDNSLKLKLKANTLVLVFIYLEKKTKTDLKKSKCVKLINIVCEHKSIIFGNQKYFLYIYN